MENGVSLSSRSTFEGRLPEKTLCGTSALGDALGADLVGGLADGQRVGLGEEAEESGAPARW